MCILSIDHQAGRFGNNIQQLALASHYAFIENNCKELIFKKEKAKRSR